jgi:hypothetical protein
MPLPVLPPLAFCAALFFFWTSSRRRGASRLPPGPPRDPLIGNLRQMPTEQAPLMFHEWGKTYGALYITLSRCSRLFREFTFSIHSFIQETLFIYKFRAAPSSFSIPCKLRRICSTSEVSFIAIALSSLSSNCMCCFPVPRFNCDAYSPADSDGRRR